MALDRSQLSFSQQRMWFVQEWTDGGLPLNLPLALRIRGALRVDALRDALDDVVARQGSLRTVYPAVDGVPRQVPLGTAADRVRVPWTMTPCTWDALSNSLVDETHRPFDLATEIPIRASLRTMDRDDHILLLVIHHIATDGWSTVPLLRNLDTAYRARIAGRSPDWPPLPADYPDYAVAQRTDLGQADNPVSRMAELLAYWRCALDGMIDDAAIRPDRPRPDQPTFRGRTLPLTVSPSLHACLLDLGRRTRTSLFMVVHAAVVAVLCRMEGHTDIPVGTFVAGRTSEMYDDLVGSFVNEIVLRTDVSGNPSFADLLTRIRDVDLNAFDHQDMPFDELVRRIAPARVAFGNPLFQTLLVLQSNVHNSPTLADLMVEDHLFDSGVARFDLSFAVWENYSDSGTPAGMSGGINWCVDLFETSTIETIRSNLHTVLELAATEPAIRLDAMALLPFDRPNTTVVDDVPPIVRNAGDANPLVPEITSIVADFLGPTSADDNFFTLGGHSMLAVRVAARIRATTGADCSVRDLFQALTPRRLAAHLAAVATRRT